MVTRMGFRKVPSTWCNATIFNTSSKFPRFKLTIGLFLLCFTFFLTGTLHSQDLDVPYVPTPNDVVEKMLDLADVHSSDYVIDLGSGDGRIVIAAAKRGAVGHGVDLDPQRVKEARQNAQESGVDDRVLFLQEDIFETDFSQASVVTMYLLSSVNEKLRPSLLENLQPGTRVVSHSFDMGDWKPDNYVRFSNRNIYYWVIPAKIGENWQWTTNGNQFDMAAKQEYQEINVNVHSDNRPLSTEEAALNGERINLILEDSRDDTRYIYSGRVLDDEIIGTVQIHTDGSQHLERWSAMLIDE